MQRTSQHWTSSRALIRHMLQSKRGQKERVLRTTSQVDWPDRFAPEDLRTSRDPRSDYVGKTFRARRRTCILVFSDSRKETTLPNLNAPASVYRTEMRSPSLTRYVPRPVFSGTVAQCSRWMRARHEGYPDTLHMEVSLDAGFNKTRLWYKDADALIT